MDGLVCDASTGDCVPPAAACDGFGQCDGGGFCNLATGFCQATRPTIANYLGFQDSSFPLSYQQEGPSEPTLHDGGVLTAVPEEAQDIQLILDPLLNLSSGAVQRIYTEVFPCGEGPAGLTVCAFSPDPPPAGNYVFLVAEFADDIPLAHPERFYLYGFVFDGDADETNNVVPEPPFPNHSSAFTDQFFQIGYDPMFGWSHGFVGRRDGGFQFPQSNARIIISGKQLGILVPACEFEAETPTFRVTAFSHEGDLGFNGGFWSGDHYPLVGDPLLPVASSADVVEVPE